MKYNPQKHHRRSIRLKDYDYTQPGAYFITICAYQSMHVFGEVINGEMVLNEVGKIAWDEWFKTAENRPYVKLYENEFVVMPNHAHGIIHIVEQVGTPRGGVQDGDVQDGDVQDGDVQDGDVQDGDVQDEDGPQAGEQTGKRAWQRRSPTRETFGKPVPGSIPTIVRAYKSAVTYAVNAVENTRGSVLWQKNYYERVIRNDRELQNIGWYILNNPVNWQLDRDNLQNLRKLSPPEKTEAYTKDVEDMILKLKASRE